MPALRKHLALGLAAGLLLALGILDAVRPPREQVMAGAYVASVRAYQHLARPAMRGLVRCRFHPSCSEYSLEAVETHGIARGIALTARRLARCTPAVPAGTLDPVPGIGAPRDAAWARAR